MASLVIIAKPSGGLTYDDNDVVQLLPAEQNPGASVAQNTPPRFLFCYITDKDVSDPEIVDLMAPYEGDLIDPQDPDQGREQLGKRKNTCTLPGPIDLACQTYHPYDEAPGQVKFTWAQFQALTAQKGQ
jgi:hypothetical protein